MQSSSLYPQRCRSGFTLLEVLAFGVLIVFAGILGFTAYSTLVNADLFSESQIKAVNVAQKCLEAAEAQANINFDTFNTSNLQTILASDTASDPAFAVYNPQVVVNTTSNAQIKQIDLTISWNFQGKPFDLKYSLLVTRPPVGLPGDIKGTVTDSNGDLVVNATVSVTNIQNPSLSFSTTTNAEGVFTFAAPGTGAFTLQPGAWTLSAFSANEQNFIESSPVDVFSGEQTPFNFQMASDPQPATINVNAYYNNPANPGDPNNGKPINTSVSFLQYGYNYGNALGNLISGNWFVPNTPGKFTIPGAAFLPPNCYKGTGQGAVACQQCFTVTTDYQYYTGAVPTQSPYAYAMGPGDTAQNHLGFSQDACPASDTPFGTAYDYRGASSQVEPFGPAGGSLSCGLGVNSFWGYGTSGTAVADNVCVSGGQTVNVNIPLVPNPTATLTGKLYYLGGGMGAARPETTGSVTVYWGPGVPDANSSGQGPSMAYTAAIKPDGTFSVAIPAAQDLFPNSISYYLGIQACSQAWNYTENAPTGKQALICTPPYLLANIYPPGFPNGTDLDYNNINYTIDATGNDTVDSTSPTGIHAGQTVYKEMDIGDVNANAPGPPPSGCWYVNTYVYNAYTGAPLPGATVTLPQYGGATATSDSTGNADFGCIGSFQCPGIMDASANSYYPFIQGQTAWYFVSGWDGGSFTSPSFNFYYNGCAVNYAGTPYIQGYTMSPIYLIPQDQFGKVNVVVEDSSSGDCTNTAAPNTYLQNFSVSLYNGDSASIPLPSGNNGNFEMWDGNYPEPTQCSNASCTTDVNGQVSFTNVYPSWMTPTFQSTAAGAANASNYWNLTPLTLAVAASPPSSESAFYTPASVNKITLTPGQTETIRVCVQKTQGT